MEGMVNGFYFSTIMNVDQNGLKMVVLPNFNGEHARKMIWSKIRDL